MEKGWILPSATIVSVFMFVAVTASSDHRRREREAFYRHEMYRKMLDQPGVSVEAVREMMRQDDQRRWQVEWRHEHGDGEGLKLAGVILMAVGVGLGVFMFYLIPDEPAYLVALIPFLIGVAILFYRCALASRKEDSKA